MKRVRLANPAGLDNAAAISIGEQFLDVERPAPMPIKVYLKIDGRMVYLWRAVDAEGEVLDVLVQSKRNKHAALKLMRKLLRKYAVVPERMVTDDLRSYGAATLHLGIDHLHDRGRWSRVDDWRSGCRSRGVAVRRQLSHIARASIRTVAPFPVAARQ